MKGVRDWVFSQILSKSVVSPSSLSGGNSFYAEEHRIQNENFNEQGTTLILLFVTSNGVIENAHNFISFYNENAHG